MVRIYWSLLGIKKKEGNLFNVILSDTVGQVRNVYATLVNVVVASVAAPVPASVAIPLTVAAIPVTAP